MQIRRYFTRSKSQSISPAIDEVSPESQKTDPRAPETRKKKPAAKAKNLVRCTACTEFIERRATLKALCPHRYCYPCIAKMFECTIDSSDYFWPPTCCSKEIPLWLASECLSQDTIKRFKDKMTEHKDINKTYCFNSNCARYLAPSRCRDRIRVCDHCLERTCTSCKESSHRGKCNKVHNDGTKEFLALAMKKRWRNCPQCLRMLQRYDGCNNLSCFCGAQVCYGCGNTSTGCTCKMGRKVQPRW